jgi:hypothetical protein
MAERHRLVAAQRIGLMHIAAIRQRLRKPPRGRRPVNAKEPELALVRPGQQVRQQAHQPQLVGAARHAGLGARWRDEKAINGVIDAAVLPPKQRIQAQLDRRAGLRVACQGIQKV